MVPASNLVAYLLGAVALSQPPWVVVAASVSAVLLLGTRERLHGLIRIVPQDELLTAGSFLILVGIILPLVPDQPVMAVTPLTPFHVWLAVVAVCTIVLSDLSTAKVYPRAEDDLAPRDPRRHLLVDGNDRRARQTPKGRWHRALRACSRHRRCNSDDVLAPWRGRRLFNVNLASALAPALAILFAMGTALAIYEWRRTTEQPDTDLQIPAINPLQIAAAITFGAIFVATSVVTAFIHTMFGQTGVLVLAGFVG